jgi:hypothetical protein
MSLHETFIDIEQRSRVSLLSRSHTYSQRLDCVGEPVPNGIGQTPTDGLLLGLLQQCGQPFADLEYRLWL